MYLLFFPKKNVFIIFGKIISFCFQQNLGYHLHGNETLGAL